MTDIVLVRDDYQRTDGYVNATKLCKKAGKLWADYSRLESTKAFLEALSRSMGIPIDVLIVSVVTGKNENRGTWVHPRVATHLAQWLSPEFAAQVSGWVEELITTGSVAIAPPQQEMLIGAYANRSKLAFEGVKELPPGYWCVFLESMQLMIYVEQVLKMPIDQFDLIDGSIGKRWSTHREGKVWMCDRVKIKYQFPDGRWCNPWAYEMSELGHFRTFMNEEYKTVHLPQYLESKYGAIVKL